MEREREGEAMNDRGVDVQEAEAGRADDRFYVGLL